MNSIFIIKDEAKSIGRVNVELFVFINLNDYTSALHTFAHSGSDSGIHGIRALNLR